MTTRRVRVHAARRRAKEHAVGGAGFGFLAAA